MVAIRSDLTGARWVPVEQLHLTLRFIGDVDDALLLALRKGFREIQALPLSLTFSGIGRFPARGNPRVLWVGLTTSSPLLALQGQVELACVKAGVLKAEQRFSPHITVARLKSPTHEEVAAFISRNAGFRCDPFTAREFYLYESTLTGQGAIHRVVESYRLGPA
jgi:2'-5' RNA ligase